MSVVNQRRYRVLFLCTHNSARSQMAEGWLRHRHSHRFEAHSAGTEAAAIRPLAIRAMQEIGVDTSGQQSNMLDQYLHQPWDYVITVCDQANQACPVFPGGEHRLHWSVPDPSEARGSHEEQLAVYRQVRDQLRRCIDQFVDHTEGEPHAR